MNRILISACIVLSFLLQACDKVEPPYGEGGVPTQTNSVTIDIGTVTGSIIDYSVSSATESDTSLLYANWFYKVSGDTAFASVIFTWNGIKSDSITSFVTPAGSVNFDDTLAIAAGSPYGTLSFHYIADIGSDGTGIATVIVNIYKPQNVKKVLLVDFTGQQCTFCPNGARKAVELQGIYGEQLIVVAIHAGSFAIPASTGSMYTYDFRTPEGNQIAGPTDFNVQTFPNGAVNFKKFNGSVLQSYPSWGGSVASLLAIQPAASLTITPTYNSTNRTSSITVDATFLNQLSGDYNLAVYLTEDSIVNWQYDNFVDVPNYVHRHALRGSYKGAYGELLASNPIASSTFTKSYSLIVNNTFDENHCAIVAFILDAATKEVVQAEEVHLIP